MKPHEIIISFAIISKYDTTSIRCEHDVLYAMDNKNVLNVSTEDKQILESLGWSFSDEEYIYYNL